MKALWLGVCLLVVGAARTAAADGCTMDSDCKGGRVCLANACQAPLPPPAPASCRKDVDCSGELVCTQNVCSAPEANTAPLPVPVPVTVAPPAAVPTPVAAPVPVPVTTPPPAPAPAAYVPPVPASVPAPEATVSSDSEPSTAFWRRRGGFAMDAQLCTGVFGAVGEMAADGYAYIGESSAIGFNTVNGPGGALALMVMSTYDLVNTDQTINHLFFGAGLRYSSGTSYTSVRFGLGIDNLSVSESTDDGIYGLGMTLSAIFAGRARAGFGIDTTLGVYDGLVVVRLGVSAAFTN